MSCHTTTEIEPRSRRKPTDSRAIERFRRFKHHNSRQQFFKPVIERLEERCLLAAVVSWDGGVAGSGTDWNISANWVGDELPTAADDVQIGHAFAGITINHSAASTTIRSLVSEANLEITSGSFSIVFGSGAPASEISHAIIVSGGTLAITSTVLNGAGQVTNSSALTVNASTISTKLENLGLLSIQGSASTINGAFHNAFGASLSISGAGGCGGGSPGTLTVASGFTNEGSITLNTAGNSCGTGDGSATLNVTNGTLVNAIEATILASKSNTNGANFLNAALDNRGTITVDYALTLAKPSAQHSSSGTINLRNGDLTVGQLGTSPAFGTSGGIDIAAGRTLTVSGGTFHYDAGTLSGTGTFVLSSTTAHITPNFSPPFNIELRSSTLNGPGHVTLVRPLLLAGGIVNSDVDLDNHSAISVIGSASRINGAFHNGASLNISGAGGCGGGSSGTLTVATGFTNEGSITLNTAGNACGTGDGSATLNITNGMLVNAKDAKILASKSNTNGANFLNAALSNQGTLTVDYTLTLSKPSAHHSNSGTINLRNDDLTVAQSGTSPSFGTSGKIDIAAGRMLTINNGAFDLAHDFTLPFGRSINLNGVNVTGDGQWINQGTLNVINSSVGVGLTNASGGQIVTTGTTSSFTGKFNNAFGATLAIGNGAGNADAGLTVASGFTNAGFLGLTAVSSNGSQPHSAALNVTSGTLVNTGTISSSGNHFTDLGFDNRLNAELDNQGTLSIGARPLTINKSGAHHSNSGTISLASGQLFAITSGTLTNLSAGTLTGGTYLIAGTFQFPNAAIATNAANIVLDGAAATIVNQSNTNALSNLASNVAGSSFTIKNSRNFTTSSAFNNAGTLGVGVGSTFTVIGNYTQNDMAALHVDIGGSPASGQFGRIISSSSVGLDGSLNVGLVNGFGPTKGQSYSIMTFASHSGDFSTVTGLNLGRVQVFEKVTAAATVILTAVADATDLAFDSVIVSPTGSVGDSVEIFYTARNLTSTADDGVWMDSLYLSRDSALDETDLLVRRVPHSGVAGLATYTETLVAPLPTALEGDYRVIVVIDSRGLVPDRGRENNTGVSAGVIRVQVAALRLGQTLSSSIDAGQDRLFTLDVPTAGTVQLVFETDAVGGVELLVGQGTIPDRASLGPLDQFVSNQATRRQEAVLSGIAGRYYLLLSGKSLEAGATRAFSLTARSLAFVASNVIPNHGSNVGQATITLTGSGYSPDTVVSLVPSAGTPRDAVQVAVRDANSLFATFDLKGLIPGIYDLRVNDNGQTSTLPAAFTVTTGAAGHTETRIGSPQVIRPFRQGIVTVDYFNAGDTDVPAPILTITAENANLGFLNQDGFVGDRIQVLGINLDGAAGTLPPGAHGRVTLKFLPKVFGAHQTSQFNLEVQAAPETPFDLASVKDDLRPPNVSADAWDVVFANLTARVGDTLGQYQTLLDETATALSQFGEYTADISRLLGFAIAQTNNAYPGLTLAQSRDASAPAPGSLSLSLDRTYLQPITGRYRLGDFGRGWTHSWEISAAEDGEGNITVQSDDHERFFRRQADGTFFGTFGNAAVLTRLPGGSHSLRETDGTLFTFQPDGKLTQIEDPNGNGITANYTGGVLTSLVHSDGDTFTLDHNAQGRISQLTDQAGRVTSYTYDVLGEHLLSVSGPEGTISYSYATGLGAAREHALESVTNRDGSHVFFSYDAQGPLVGRGRDGGTEAITLAYDATGGVTTTDANGAATTTQFNDAGQIAQVRNPLGHLTQFNFDASDQLLRTSAPGNLAGTTQHDPLGNLVSQVDPLGHSIQLTYDATFSRPVSFRDELGVLTGYKYDADGNRIALTYPDGQAEQFNYDTPGNLTQFQNRRGQSIRFTYNARGRVTRKDHDDGKREDYAYDNRGNLLTASDTNGTTTFTYDNVDRLTSVLDPAARSLHYTYDAGGRRTKMVDQAGFAVNYAYDGLGRLATLTDGGGAMIAGYTYDPAGRLAREDKGNLTFTTYEYDAAGQLLQLVNHAGDGSANSQFEYAYNELGLRTSMTTLDGITTYGYDALGQLNSVALPGGRTIVYAYDAVGNRVSVTDAGLATNYKVNDLQQYLSVGSAARSYDADGNLISETVGGQISTYTYDDENRLVTVDTPAGAWKYEYDSLGNRIATIENGQRTDYLLDPTGLVNVAGEYDATGTLLARYVHSSFGLVSQLDAAGAAAFYDFDSPGSTVALTAANGAILNRYSYLPFGEKLTATESVANPFRYVGGLGVMAEDNGLSFMRHRFYQAQVGAFMSIDPLRLPGGDVYTYAVNNPIGFVDPSGLQEGDDDLLGRGPDDECVFVAGKIVCGKRIPRNNRLFCEQHPKMLGNTDCSKFEPKPPPAPLKPPRHPRRPGGSSGTEQKIPLDPNNIVGPAGFGADGFVPPNQTLTYTINFENKPTADLAAQVVVITQQLDPDLDLRTFELGDFGFGATVVHVPAGRSFFSTRVDARTTVGLFVDVTAGIDTSTGLATWTFTSTDPQSFDVPLDVFAGFLPPNHTAPEGEGFVSYLVRSKTVPPTGTRLDAQARVIFDTNDPIDTPAIFNTLDAGTPSSNVVGLPPLENASFTVKWAGADDAGGSGLESFDVFVSDNGGPFAPFQSHTTQTSALFTGLPGHTYRFHTVAADNVGHAETAPATPDTQTVISGNPWQNAENRLDTDHDLFVVASDVVAIINFINAGQSGLLPDTRPPGKAFVDVNGDKNVAADDVVTIINYINAHPDRESEPPVSSPALSEAAATSKQRVSNGQQLPSDLFALLALDIASQPKRRRY